LFLKKILFLSASGILIVLVILGFVLFSQAHKETGISDTEDTKQIEAVLQRSYDLEAKASQDFDLSLFPSVFINDPRVKLSASTVQFIQKVRGMKGEAPREDYGFLDYKIAYFELWGSGATQIETIQTEANQEDRDLTSEERQTMANSMPRSKGPVLSAKLIFRSIKVERDMATAVFDDGPRLNEMRLVRIKNDWFIAGWKILETHA
jgi:hypothetical protein